MKAALVLFAILLCPMALSAGGALRLEFVLPANSYLAVRFRVDDQTDFEDDIVAYTCEGDDGRPAQAFGDRLILDGELSFGAFGPGGTVGIAPDARLVEVGAQGHAFSTPDVWRDDLLLPQVVTVSGGGCWRAHYGIAPWLRGGSVLTDVRWTTTPGTVFINATWTHGFLGYDAVQGPIGAFKPHEFEQGAAVGITPAFFGGAGAGALLSQTIATEHDTIGDWWPYVGAHPGGDSYCYEDRVACPEFQHHYFFRSKGPTTWQWGFHLRPELSTPHYPLIVIELPDDSYLTE